MSSARALVAAAVCFAATGCSSGVGQDSADVVDAPRGELALMVTVDWEGRDLLDHNLAAMNALRDRFPEVRLVQFLNAAYFLKPDVDADDVRDRIDSVLRDGDELGLHIHGWKRLFEAAGVTWRDTPTFWGGSVSSWSCRIDCGHEVPIRAYERDELATVIRFSVDTLDENGFGRATSFRAGGWMADKNVREALVLEGFTVDSSAVPADFLEGEIGDLPLHDWVAALWEGTESTSQPYALDGLTEVPDNGALADYVTADEMFTVYQAAKDKLLADPDEDVVLNIGFHQETAQKYLPRIEGALARILDDAEQSGVALRSTTMAR